MTLEQALQRFEALADTLYSARDARLVSTLVADIRRETERSAVELQKRAWVAYRAALLAQIFNIQTDAVSDLQREAAILSLQARRLLGIEP